MISDVFLYIDMVANFRRGHDTTIEREVAVKDRAIAYIQKHLVYASPRLVSSYHQIHSSAISDQRGANPSTAELNFLHDFIREYIDVIERASIFLGKNKREQLSPVYGRLILYYLYVQYEAGVYSNLTSYSWKFDRTAYTPKTYDKLKKIMSEQREASEKMSRKEALRMKELEKSLAGKDEDERTRLWNQSMEEHRPSQDMAWQESVDGSIRRILDVMIRDKSDRDDVMRWLAAARDNPSFYV